MKLKGNDGIVREFQTTKEVLTVGGHWDGMNYTDTICLNCKENFGVHSMKAIKTKLKEHVCETHNSTSVKQ